MSPETTSHPDGMRMAGGMFHALPQRWERSFFFLSINTNKRGITLDLRSGEEFTLADDDQLAANLSTRLSTPPDGGAT